RVTDRFLIGRRNEMGMIGEPDGDGLLQGKVVMLGEDLLDVEKATRQFNGDFMLIFMGFNAADLAVSGKYFRLADLELERNVIIHILQPGETLRADKTDAAHTDVVDIKRLIIHFDNRCDTVHQFFSVESLSAVKNAPTFSPGKLFIMFHVTPRTRLLLFNKSNTPRDLLFFRYSPGNIPKNNNANSCAAAKLTLFINHEN